MDIVFRYIGGGILSILAVAIMLYLSWYSGLIWEGKEPPSLIKGLVMVFAFWLFFYSIRLFGATIALSITITVLTLGTCLNISCLISYLRNKEERPPMLDLIVWIILYILMGETLIFAYWYSKVTGVESALEEFFKSVFKK